MQAVVRGSETILVVEDDEGVRATAVELLTDMGYRVLKAPDAASALAVVESGVAIDVLFTDVVMPGTLRSPELARRVRERLPDVAVLFTSGYTENAIVHGGRLDEGVSLLPKPYTREAMSRKIRSVLDTQKEANAARQLRSGVRAAQARAQPAVPSRPLPLTILLVEDEEIIRMSTAELLRDLGHTVLEAGNAEEASKLLQRCAVDALITDIQLPGKSGFQLADEARSLHPEVAVAFSSGSDRLPDDRREAILLRKPYDETHCRAVS